MCEAEKWKTRRNKTKQNKNSVPKRYLAILGFPRTTNRSIPFPGSVCIDRSCYEIPIPGVKQIQVLLEFELVDSLDESHVETFPELPTGHDESDYGLLLKKLHYNSYTGRSLRRWMSKCYTTMVGIKDLNMIFLPRYLSLHCPQIQFATSNIITHSSDQMIFLQEVEFQPTRSLHDGHIYQTIDDVLKVLRQFLSVLLVFPWLLSASLLSLIRFRSCEQMLF